MPCHQTGLAVVQQYLDARRIDRPEGFPAEIKKVRSAYALEQLLAQCSQADILIDEDRA